MSSRRHVYAEFEVGNSSRICLASVQAICKARTMLRRQLSKRILLVGGLASLAATFALASCGGPSPESSASTPPTAAASNTSASTTNTSTTNTSSPQNTSTASTDSESVPTVEIPVESPVKLEPISARYTCAGANVPPPIKWSEIPPGTVELDLFVLNVQPIHEKIFSDWAVAGLKPTLHGLTSGKLPPGAIVGRNSFGQTGYSVCPPPPRGTKVTYVVQLYALPHKIPVKPGFVSGEISSKAFHTAKYIGRFEFYARR
jgi:phosphatidylethanolamine-binding protein (PEBP) family uncharacterized protein